MAKKLLSCGELMKRICDIFEARANKDLQEQDITLSQMKILVYLDNASDKSATLKELEKYFGTAQATIAGIAVRLEKKGLIESYIDTEDRRIKHVRLSETGQELCCHTKSQVEAGDVQLLGALEPAERAEFQMLLQKVYDNLL